MNIYLLGKNSAMLFFEKEDLEKHPNDDLYSLAASVLPEEFAGKGADMVSFSINGGMILHLNKPEKQLCALPIERPGRLYDNLINLQTLFARQYCEIYKACGTYYAVLEECRLTHSLRSALGGRPVSLEFILEHGVRVSSFLLDRETVGQRAHRGI